MEQFFANLDSFCCTFEFDQILYFILQYFQFLNKPLQQIVPYFDWRLDRFLHYFI